MKEIGSEFWNIPISEKNNNLFSKETTWFLSGRIALKAIIEDIKSKKMISTVSMPSWCCESMIIPFLNEGIEVKFYNPFAERTKLNKISTDSIVIMDYFGYTGHSDIGKYDGIIIRDVTHSIFSKKYSDADYYFGSLRKWAGFLTGGFAFKLKSSGERDLDYEKLRATAMKEKKKYINNETDSKGYLEIFSEAEEYLDNIDNIKGASEIDILNAQKFDEKYVISRRRKNAQILLEAFKDHVIFEIVKESDCPMFVPITVPNGKRDELRKYLISNNIYCPVHWPISKYHLIDEETKSLYGKELSLVCDQRYSEEDMYKIVDVIKQFWKEYKV